MAGILDHYAASWRKAYAGTCQKTYVAHKQSEGDFYLSRQCLLRRRRALQALVGVYRRADERTVQAAVEGAEKLRPVKGCLDIEALRAGVPPPKDPETRKQVAALRGELADIDALRQAGRYKEGIRRANAAVARARKLDYRPILGEALLRLGRIDHAADDAPGARKALKQAEYVADVAGDDPLKARVLVEEVDADADFSTDFQSLRKLAMRAQTAVRRHGDDPTLGIRLKAALARTYIERSKPKNLRKADALLSSALATAREDLGPDDTRVARVLTTMSQVRAFERRFDDELALSKQALAIERKRLGPQHPEVASATDLVASALQNLGRYDEAHALHAKAAAFWKTNAVGRELVNIHRKLSQVPSGPPVSGRVVDERGHPVAGATVIVGPGVEGDGKYAGGLSVGQRAQAQGVQRAVTGTGGRFKIDGVAQGVVVAIAEKGDTGRSWPALIDTDKKRAAAVLKLRPYARLGGHVKIAGTPPRELVVQAIPRTRRGSGAYRAIATVDRRGRFAFERLAAGRYMLEAVSLFSLGAGEVRTEDVDVAAGRNKPVALDLPGGPSLTVVVRGPKGQTVPVGLVVLIPGSGALPTTIGAMFGMLHGAHAGGAGYMAPGFHGAPAVFRGVAPGRYRMCVAESSRDVNDPKIVWGLFRAVAGQPVTCRRIAVAPAPAKQKLTVTAQHIIDLGAPAKAPQPPKASHHRGSPRPSDSR